MVLGPLIGAASSLIGGIFGSNSAKKQQQAQLELQEDFAKKGIQWRVKDAQKAGIHPLYALGAQTSQFSPIAISGNDMGAGIAAAGQDLSRAIDATRTQGDRNSAITKTMQDLQLTRMGLENELLSAQIARVKQPGNPPPMPSTVDNFLVPGQGQAVVPSAGVLDQLMKRTVSDPSAKFQEPGAVTDRSFTRTDSGGLAPVMSVDAKERLEEDFIGGLTWNVRNRLMPILYPSSLKPPYPAPPGQRWRFSPWRQEYYLERYSPRN